MKKKFLSVFVACAMALTFVACGNNENNNSSANNSFVAGTYEGTAKGFGGEIKATVKLSDSKIEEIVVVGDKETPTIGGVAVESMPKEMVEKQIANVDIVSGATVTSNAVIEAVTAALASAGIDASTLVAQEGSTAEKTEETLNVDCVVVGAGGAGMTAALEAKAAGLNVIIVEKMAMAGGNSVKATGGMNAADTDVQESYGVEDSVEIFVEDTMKGGYELNNRELVTKMAEESSDAIEWLEEIGAPLPELSFSGGATNKRIHRPEGGEPVGSFIVDALIKNVEEQGIEIIYNTEAKEILTADNTVSGIKAEGKDKNYIINAKAVILATGGFGANEDMYTQYRPELKGFVTTNTPGATGDGIKMAEAVGANLVDIEQIQIHPTVEQTTSLLITESVRGGGAILVNKDAKRFGNELLTRDVVSASIIEQEDGYAYTIFDQQLRDSLSAIEKYVENNIVVQADTIEGLAKELGLDEATLVSTVNTWNEAVANQNDAEFGRNTGMEKNISVGPFYAIKIAPGVHHTMGGVEINTNAEVISKEDTVIPGLFAAGEVAGGVHGGNRIGGTAVTDFVVFGRIAGQSAGNFVNR
ncbi:Fumarate reductase flavoprotein subunit precursor [uncultured Clostridium sp.]|uniref:flavocytochrome c n=1 Tax=uncultured Clostridium sp. TaxID=59620 RepID=UPI0008213FCD|nr:flavocytochrome c [uncultured Clostridium sp.]SCI86465.1 Fumarate reductase flavoprotein subunit precursor [uncultured Clostridium sp.]